MTQIESKVKEIKQLNRNINELLDVGQLHITRSNGTDFLDKKEIPVGIRPIYSEPEVCVCVGKFPQKGGVIDDHLHQGCREYFVITKGKMLLNIEGVKRIMRARDCAAVDEDQIHSCEGLEDNTEYIVISVPQDKKIAELFSKVIADTAAGEG